ncbi:MAG: acyl carrier protein, partial [Rubripirellula sp.]
MANELDGSLATSGVDAKAETPTTQQLIHDTISQYVAANLGFQVDSIGYDDSLFDLGIDSMGVAEISAGIEEKTGKRLVAEAVFELETINELSEYVDSLQPIGETQSQFSPLGNGAANPSAEGNSVSASEAAMIHGSEADPLDHYRRLNRRVNQLKEADMYFFESVISEHNDAWVVADG